MLRNTLWVYLSLDKFSNLMHHTFSIRAYLQHDAALAYDKHGRKNPLRKVSPFCLCPLWHFCKFQNSFTFYPPPFGSGPLLYLCQPRILKCWFMLLLKSWVTKQTRQEGAFPEAIIGPKSIKNQGGCCICGF